MNRLHLLSAIASFTAAFLAADLIVSARSIPIAETSSAVQPPEGAVSRPAVATTRAMPQGVVGDIRKGVAVAIPAQITIRADAAYVWKMLISIDGFEMITGLRIDPADRDKTLGKVGDSVAAGQWSDDGRAIVTKFDANKELRVIFEPAKADYLCARRIVVAAMGEQCVLQYWDQYTDFQASADQTAGKQRESIEKAIGAFKALAEKRGK